MILVLDTGNTNIHFGLFRERELVVQWRISTDTRATSDELGLSLIKFIEGHGFSKGDIEGIAVASVVPPLFSVLKTGIERYIGQESFFIDPVLHAGMPILYDQPSDVGADRVANAVAGIEIAGKPLVIVDFGTATTFDVISGSGEYLGGVIAPGIELSIEALTHKAARLPRLDPALPSRVIGRNTRESMQSGIIFGYAGLVDHLIFQIHEEMEFEAEVVSTGGMASMIAPYTSRVKRIEPNLTLEGILLIYRRNMV
jgi:type III pantothenate kinase